MRSGTEHNHSQPSLDAELLDVVETVPSDWSRFRQLLEDGADPNIRDDSNQPLLHILARIGEHSAIRSAIQAGADIHAVDDDGETALFVASTKEAVLALLQGGASPTVTNHANDSPAGARSRFYNNHEAYLATELLKNCETIARTADKGGLSARTWQELWRDDFPQGEMLAYLLQRMEEHGVALPKSVLDEESESGRGLRRTINTDNAAVVLAWRDHCDRNGTPMTPQDWEKTGLLNVKGRADCLLTADYWAQRPSLEGMFALLEAMPDKAFDPPSPGLDKTVSQTLTAWLDGPGKELTSEGLRALRQDMPEKARGLFHGYHTLLTQRQFEERPPVTRGR